MKSVSVYGIGKGKIKESIETRFQNGVVEMVNLFTSMLPLLCRSSLGVVADLISVMTISPVQICWEID